MNHQYKERAESERSEHYHSFRNQEEAKAEVWSWHSHKSLDQDTSHNMSVHTLRLKLHTKETRHHLTTGDKKIFRTGMVI